MIYGVSILALCMLLGKALGEAIGHLLGVNADIGGVGFAILILLVISNSSKFTFLQRKDVVDGILFWKRMYIPVVVAMAASQNVFSMLSSGLLTIVAGGAAVGLSFFFIYLLNKFWKSIPTNSSSNEYNEM